MDTYVVGDTSPPYTVVLFDGAARYDATDAPSVRVKLWRDGVLIADREATSVSADGTVTLNLLTSDTSEAGPLLGRVVVATAEGPATFPPNGYLRTLVHPVAP